MIYTIRRKRMAKRIGDVSLANELSKALRTITTVESGDHALSLPGGADQRGGLPRYLQLLLGGNHEDGHG